MTIFPFLRQCLWVFIGDHSSLLHQPHTHTPNLGVSFVLVFLTLSDDTHSETCEIRKSVWGFILSLRLVFLSLEDFKASATSCPPTTWLSCVTCARENRNHVNHHHHKIENNLELLLTRWLPSYFWEWWMEIKWSVWRQCIFSGSCFEFVREILHLSCETGIKRIPSVRYWPAGSAHTVVLPQTMCSNTSPVFLIQ